jgi:hypothetical protein|tara:strand:+ start:1539 stop:2477 length:939 start_codon:yes stop_codon:yes gene_type:complete
MTYIPKSQIKSHQFTSGAEWYYVKNNSSYIGDYFILSNGKAYTGATPNNSPNDEITKKIPLQSPQSKMDYMPSSPLAVEYADNWDGYTFEQQKQNIQDIEIYGILTDTDYNLIRSRPQYIPSTPTLENFKEGLFKRYFVTKINQFEYIEINQETYDNIVTKNSVWMWEDYIPFSLNWYIKGDIDRTFNNNVGAIFLAEKEINRKGLEDYLSKNFLEYFEYPEANNLTTNGGELITQTGIDYAGPYHINKIQGPMVGSNHTLTSHHRLLYKRFYISQVVDVLNQEGVIETGESQNIEYRASISPNRSSNGGGY